jgi:hypothetical protein
MFADDIIWDVESEPEEELEDAMERLGLPSCVELPKWLQLSDEELIDGYDSETYDDICEWLSNQYGHCVKSFIVE